MTRLLPQVDQGDQLILESKVEDDRTRLNGLRPDTTQVYNDPGVKKRTDLQVNGLGGCDVYVSRLGSRRRPR